MSWINSNATYKQNSKNDLSFYHGFSKTPVEPTSTGTAATTLANASTKGGHTVIGTEVWAEEIPWFGLVASRAAAVTRLSGLTKLNDLVKVDGEGGKVYKYKGANDATFTEDTWTDFWEEITLTNGMELKNRHNQPVLRYYLNQPMQTLTTTNNASIDSKGYATRLFVNESDHTGQTSGGSVVSQFAAGTDNIKNGIPSVELNPKLYYNTTEKIAGTHYYDYNVSGTILWNENVASRGVKISCFRYIGKTVTAKTAEIESTIEDLKIAAGAGITVSDGTNSKKGVTTLTLGGSNGVTVTVDETTGAVTFGVNTSTVATTASVKAISDRISSAADDITANSEKLVTGKAVYYYVAGATLTSADDAIQSATDGNANKLVTAAQVKEYVTKNAQVTVTDGKTDVTATGFEFTGSTGIDVSITAALEEVTGADDKKTGKVTYSATLSKATVDATTGTITNGDLAVSASDAEKIATAKAKAEIEAAIADGSTIDTRIDEVLSANTASLNTDNTIKTGDESKFVTAGDADKIADKAIADSLADTINDNTIGKAISDVQSDVDDKVADVTVDGTSIVSGEAGSKTAALTTTGVTAITPSSTSTSNKLATESSVAQALASITSVGVSYEVIPDGQTHTSITEPVKGRIYLEKDETDATAGIYIEWMYTEKGWEQIGSTKTDHSSYASTITVNNETKTVSESSVDLGAFASTVADGTVTGTVSSTGVLTLTIDDATTSQKGAVQLTDTYTSTDDTQAATGKSIAAAIATLDATDVGEGAVKVSQTDGKVSSVTVETESLVADDAIKDSITTDTALVTAADALAAIKLAKPENYISTVSDGETDDEGNYVNVTSGETKLVIKDGRENVYPNDLWGTTVSLDGNTITVQGGPIDGTEWGQKNGYNTKDGIYINGTRYPRGSKPITKVENNKVYNGTTEVANIKTNELVNGSDMFNHTSLTSFSGDLSSLVNGSDMFNYSSLESFSGDLSSLVNGSYMFSRTSLESFSGNLSSLVNGSYMFSYTSLESFSGDLSSLVNGSRTFFASTSLTSFSGDLSSLVNSHAMFCDTSLTSFSGDLSSLVNGSSMFQDTSLTSFSGDLSSLVDGSYMFYSTSLTSFSGDLSSLVNGANMFNSTSLESFSGDLSSLVNGSSMFSSTSLTSFSGDLSSLVNGANMFNNTSLDVESVELICDVLPNYNTENGGKTLQTATWNTSGENKGKYTYSDWSSGNYYYPIIKITQDDDSMSQGNADGIDRIFDTGSISESNVKTITITWSDISVLSEADRTKIAELFTNTANEKGWTFLVNTEIAESGEIAPPNAVMATDGTIQYYVLAKKEEATEDNATHIDASGKLWKFDTAEAIIGPNIKYWSMFATVEDALTEWELTPWTKPTEEETEA